MTTMIAELYDALIAAGAPQDKARAAAAAMAEYDPYQPRFVKVEADISSIGTEITEMKGGIAVLKGDVAALKGDIAELNHRVGVLERDTFLMKWMLGFVLAFQIAIFIKPFLH